MTYEELLDTINGFDVSDLTLEQLQTLRESLMIKLSLTNYYHRIKLIRNHQSCNSQEEKCED